VIVQPSRPAFVAFVAALKTVVALAFTEPETVR